MSDQDVFYSLLHEHKYVFQVTVCSQTEFQRFCSAGYDVQSASTPGGVLYITGAPRYNHTGRVVVYRLSKKNKIAVSQILKGEQVGHLSVCDTKSS